MSPGSSFVRSPSAFEGGRNPLNVIQTKLVRITGEISQYARISLHRLSSVMPNHENRWLR